MITPKTHKPDAETPLEIVGSNKYGRYRKISDEETFNMIVSDEFLVPSPGYRKNKVIKIGNALGRAIYRSMRGNFMIVVIDNNVYRVQGTEVDLSVQRLFSLDSFTTDVFIDENAGYEIAICDQEALWIYNWRDNTVDKAVLPTNTQTGLEIVPGYVTFHDGYFIVPDLSSSFWYLSQQNQGLNWFWGAGSQPVAGSIQTKPEFAVAVLRAPGKGNLIYVFGTSVTEMWYDNGGQLFPYQRSNSISIDYGCLSSSTIAAMDDYIAWLGINEKSGPAIMVSTGGPPEKISNDGIDFKLARLVNPSKSVAFFFREDGHVFYQITFFDDKDNLTLLYDFNTKSFFTMTDENMNYHIAQRIAFYNDTYYFTSLKDGCIYEMNSKFTYYDYTEPANIPIRLEDRDIKEIPRIRVIKPLRLQDSSRFIVTSLNLLIDQGNDEFYKSSKARYITTTGGKVLATNVPDGYQGIFLQNNVTLPPYRPRIDMCIAKDGAEQFGNFVKQELNPLGVRKNRVNFYQLGAANDMSIQFRFWSKSRVVVSNGMLQIRHSHIGPEGR